MPNRAPLIDPPTGLAYVTGMAKREIIVLPDPILRKVSEPVERVDDELRELMDDMLETMYDAPGIGLAAIQVAVPKRLLVLDVADHENEERNPICMVNPVIVARGDSMCAYEEGCLSIPDVRVEIERPATVTVRYIDREGEQRQVAADGLLATAVQHEIDHLDGKLIIDHMSRLKRDMVIRKFKKSARA